MKAAQTLKDIIPSYYKHAFSQKNVEKDNTDLLNLETDTVCGKMCLEVIGLAEALSKKVEPHKIKEVRQIAVYQCEVILFG